MTYQSEHIVCAVATANGFAMPYRAATAKKERKPRHKEILPRAANGLPEADPETSSVASSRFLLSAYQ